MPHLHDHGRTSRRRAELFAGLLAALNPFGHVGGPFPSLREPARGLALSLCGGAPGDRIATSLLADVVVFLEAAPCPPGVQPWVFASTLRRARRVLFGRA